jgi:diaminohydroxyphosphoribosylaminopyrimidine deaminase/5-amino-6-(5-phosphoribosylamino)uracil reductase
MLSSILVIFANSAMPQHHEKYMRRCIELALQGAGYVTPNPMVGAVLVYEQRIIGEGYHHQYGGPHAEVNCLNSVLPEDEHLVPQSVLYVSLEPCAHFGKTPPCADLVIQKKIPKVVIGCRDPFDQVNGRGIEKLRQAGVDVETGMLEKECKDSNIRFFTWNLQKRPYILLKWACTADNKIAGAIAANRTSGRLRISNELTNREVHKWRSEEAAILVGTNTALLDNPALTNRYWSGNHPVRLVLDTSLRLPASLQLFDHSVPTVVFNRIKDENAATDLRYYRLPDKQDMVTELVQACYDMQLQSILVEGGAQLLQSFINSGIWDEARVITNTQLRIGEGMEAPVLQDALPVKHEQRGTDMIVYYKKRPA